VIDRYYRRASGGAGRRAKPVRKLFREVAAITRFGPIRDGAQANFRNANKKRPRRGRVGKGNGMTKRHPGRFDTYESRSVGLLAAPATHFLLSIESVEGPRRTNGESGKECDGQRAHFKGHFPGDRSCQGTAARGDGAKGAGRAVSCVEGWTTRHRSVGSTDDDR